MAGQAEIWPFNNSETSLRLSPLIMLTLTNPLYFLLKAGVFSWPSILPMV